jgi:predicted Zn-dependent protease with MMP-like domain
MVEVTDDRFEELVGDALDSIPDGLGRFMDNVAVFVDTEQSIGLYGLYQGVPLPDRRGYGTPYNGLPMPDRITIYKRPICARARSEADVVRQVRITVIHEVAHHFGIDDDRLQELGWA